MFNKAKNPAKYKTYQKSMANSYLDDRTSKVVNKFNKEEFDLDKSLNSELHCTLAFIYLTPLLIDYLNESYPGKIQIKSRIEYPGISVNL